MTIMREALNRITDYYDPKAEHARINALVLEAQRLPTSVEAQSVLAAAVKNATTLQDIVTAAEAFVAAQREAEVTNTVVSELIAHRSNLHNIGQLTYSNSQISPAIAYLVGELETLVNDARTCDDLLGDITTEADAIAAGDDSASAWRMLETLADRYEQIREAQRKITITLFNTDPSWKEVFAADGYLADAIDREQVWIQRRSSVATTVERLNGEQRYLDWLRPAEVLPWQRPKDRTWPDTDRVGYLRWVATDCAPWIPTPEQLQQRHSLSELIVSKPRDINELRRMTTSRTEYFEYPGIGPVNTWRNPNIIVPQGI